jgi:predicted DNA-binding protein (MmcQ/YjbR family)
MYLTMNLNDFNQFCNSLPNTTYTVQWRGSHVWKIGGKIFAIGNWVSKKNSGITFKVSKIAFECLKDELGIRPAPYLASRGMSWLQCYDEDTLNPNDLKSHLTESYRLVSLNLKKTV